MKTSPSLSVRIHGRGRKIACFLGPCCVGKTENASGCVRKRFGDTLERFSVEGAPAQCSTEAAEIPWWRDFGEESTELLTQFPDWGLIRRNAGNPRLGELLRCWGGENSRATLFEDAVCSGYNIKVLGCHDTPLGTRTRGLGTLLATVFYEPW